MYAQKSHLYLERSRQYLWRDTYFYYSADEGVYFVRISSSSFLLGDYLTEMPGFIAFPFMISSFISDRKELKRMDQYDEYYNEGNVEGLLKDARSFHLKPSEIAEISLEIDSHIKKLMKMGRLQFYLNNGTVITFNFSSDTQLDLVEELVTEHYSAVPIKRS